MNEGRLFYLVGAADAGNDKLVRYVRERLGDQDRVVFAHCYVIRRSKAGIENHLALSEAEFLLRKHSGLFVMDWESRGMRHAVGAEINYWLAMGLYVVVSGSRSYLAQALDDYPDLTVIWITAPARLVDDPDVTEEGEASSQRDAPFNRNFTEPDQSRRVFIVENDGRLERAGEKLLALLTAETRGEDLRLARSIASG